MVRVSAAIRKKVRQSNGLALECLTPTDTKGPQSMTRSMLIASFCFFACMNASAASSPDEFQVTLETTMADILCSTTVINDMNAAVQKYFSVRDSGQTSKDEKKLKSEFGKELHAIWLRQRYSMEPHQDVVKFLDYALTLPMDGQADLARSWSYAAHKRCPAVAEDYRATFAAAMTLISVIPH